MKIFSAGIGLKLIAPICMTLAFILSLMSTPMMIEAREVFETIASEAEGTLNYDTFLRSLPKRNDDQSLEELENLDVFFAVVDEVLPSRIDWSITLCMYALLTVALWVLFIHSLLMPRYDTLHQIQTEMTVSSAPFISLSKVPEGRPLPSRRRPGLKRDQRRWRRGGRGFEPWCTR